MAKKGNNAVVMSEESSNIKVVGNVSVSPDKLHFRDSDLVGRSRPVADDEVIALADSMNILAGGTGQQQPLQVRPMHTEGTYEIIFGNTRKRAADLIRSGYNGNNGKEYAPQPNFTLRCEVVDVDDATAFKRNVVENVHRNATSPIDNAVNQDILRTKYQMSDVAIQKLYGYASSASVHRLKKLLNLPADIQDRVHNGTVTLQAAVYCEEFLAKEGPEAFKSMWDSINAPGENENDPERLGSVHIGATQVADAIKAFKQARKEAQKGATTQPTGEDGTVPPVEAGNPANPDSVPSANGDSQSAPADKGKSFTLKQTKDLLVGMRDGKKSPAIVQQFAGNVLKVMEGGDMLEFKDWAFSLATDEDRERIAQIEQEEAETLRKNTEAHDKATFPQPVAV